MFSGSLVALVTPFRDNAVDEAALTGLIDWHMTQGTHGLVICGTTGESPTLSLEEHKQVVALCVRHSDGRVPVMAGTGSNATAEAIELTAHAAQIGAQAGLVVTPYYNKPTQEGLIAHYTAISDAAPDLPLYIYNIPGRSVIDMSVETMGRLARLPNIVGVKDASCDPLRITRQRQACGEDFLQLSGEDNTALGFMLAGGQGCISVSANIAPKLCAQFQTACLAGDYAQARALHEQLLPLHDALFMESSPAPTKFALAELGLCRPDVRLPLVMPGKATQAIIRKVLKDLKLR